jgi:dTDP-glucose 4,6-dehydratase
MNYLVTGSAGFIGSAFVRSLLGKSFDPRKSFSQIGSKDKIVSLDLLTYAACMENLDAVKNDSRHVFIKGNICDRTLVEGLVREHKIDCIINFAAESHVDRSIEGSEIFVRTNILGTHSLLESARLHKLRYIQVSTDEVYGALGSTGSFLEETPLKPNSPYSASKAGADMLVRSYVETHHLDAAITRCSNNYGPFQFPEKFLPLAITNLIRGEKIPVYGTGMNVRDWIHVEDHAEGVWLTTSKAKAGSVYNFGGTGERTNLEMVELIAKNFGKNPKDVFKYVEDRKGHDWRYSMDASKARSDLGWVPKWELGDGLTHMIQWYQENSQWWQPKVK